MDAACIYKNGKLQLAAEVLPSTGLAFDLFCYGSVKKGIAATITRTNELGRHERWSELRLSVGDAISLVLREVDEVDEPIESYSVEDVVARARARPKMKPRKRAKKPFREIGVLDCRIKNKPHFSLRLTTENMFSFGMIWLGDRAGKAVMHIGAEVTPKPVIRRFKFGDEMAFHFR